MGRKKLDPEKKFLAESRESESRKFRWEFLRRNERFRHECQKIIAGTTAALRMPRQNQKAFDKAIDKILNATLAFSEKWGITYARGDRYPSPDKAYGKLSKAEQALVQDSPTRPSAPLVDSIVDMYLGYGLVPQSAFSGLRAIKGSILDPDNPRGIWVPASKTEVRLKPNDGITDAEVRKIAKGDSGRVLAILNGARAQYARQIANLPMEKIINKISVEIDLNAHMGDILREVGSIVESLWRLRAASGLPGLTKPAHEGYAYMLKVFDTRKKHPGITYRDLYRKVHSLRKSDPFIDENAKTIRKTYLRACEIIDGDYRNI